MPYVKPGVEITQVQGTASPILLSPALNATVVGRPYYWLDIASDEAVYATTYSGLQHDITVSGSFGTDSSAYFDIEDADLVIIDLLATTGDSAGEIKHLIKGTDFTVNTSSNTIQLQSAIKINGNSVPSGQVRVGYRAKKEDAQDKYHILDSLDSIENALGKVVSWNGLAYGTYLAQLNSSSVVSAYGCTDVSSTGTLGALGLVETYALSFLDDGVDVSAVKTHCESLSNATNKKERIAFVNKQVSWRDDSNVAGGTFSTSSTAKAYTAANTRDTNSAYSSKRVFSTFPDVAFVRETRHLSTIKPDFIKASFSNETALTWSDYGAYCELTSTVKANGTTYQAGSKVTNAV